MKQVVRRGSDKAAMGQREVGYLLWSMEGLVRKITICLKTDSSFDSLIVMTSREIKKIMSSSSQYYNIDLIKT